jgi:hypothetical protein
MPTLEAAVKELLAHADARSSTAKKLLAHADARSPRRTP